jgi:hypothetical protein
MAQVNSPIIQSNWMVCYKKKRQLHLLFLRLSSGICLACFACSMVEQLHTFRMFRFRKDETANSPMFSRDVVVS